MSRHKTIIATSNAQNVAASARSRAATWQPADRKPSPAASTNQALAATARQRAASSTRTSTERRAWACLAVALSTTGSLTGARRVLDMIGPAGIRDMARGLLDELTKQEVDDGTSR